MRLAASPRSADNLCAARLIFCRSNLLARALADVEADTLVGTVVEHLETFWKADVRHVLLLGVGSPSASAPARHQFALALLLVAALPVKGTHARPHFIRASGE